MEVLRAARTVGTESLLLDQLLQAGSGGAYPSAADVPRIPLQGPLSTREFEVLRCMAEGFSNKQIATALDIALDTVKKHASSVMQKLDARNRTQAVARARDLRLI